MSETVTAALSAISPQSFIRATRSHPAFRWVLLVAGALSVLISVDQFGANPAFLVFASIALVALMVLFAVFARAVKLSNARMALPAMVLTWFFLIIIMILAIGMVTSAFADVPLPFRTWIVRQMDLPSAASTPKAEASAAQASKTQQAASAQRHQILRAYVQNHDLPMLDEFLSNIDLSSYTREGVQEFRRSLILKGIYESHVKTTTLDIGNSMRILPKHRVLMSEGRVEALLMYFYCDDIACVEQHYATHAKFLSDLFGVSGTRFPMSDRDRLSPLVFYGDELHAELRGADAPGINAAAVTLAFSLERSAAR